MAVDTDKDFLHQVFRTVSVADGAIHEVQQPPLVPVNQLFKRTFLTSEKRGHHLAIVQRAQVLAHRHGLRKLGCERTSKFGHQSSPPPAVM